MVESPGELVSFIERSRIAYVTLHLQTALFENPDLTLALIGMTHSKEFNALRMPRRSGGDYASFQVDNILRTGRHFIDELEVGYPCWVITRIHSDLDSLGMLKASHPLSEFLRHLAHAAENENHWDFKRHPLVRPARFRELALCPALHGHVALGETVMPGDFLDLLDDLELFVRIEGRLKR